MVVPLMILDETPEMAAGTGNQNPGRSPAPAWMCSQMAQLEDIGEGNFPVP